MAEHSLFSVFMDRDEVEVHENAKRERGQRKLSCTRLDSGEILLREQNGQPRAGKIGPSCPLG